MKVRIKQNSFIARIAAAVLKEKTMAITINKTIYLHNSSKENFLSSERWLIHEAAHVLQYRRLGLLRFLVLYATESLKKGYGNNKFEIEARRMETNPGILQHINFV